MINDANPSIEQPQSSQTGKEKLQENLSAGPRRWHAEVLQLLGILCILGVALVFFALAAGASYQLTRRQSDARRFPQEGRSVDIGGYRLNIHCLGQGHPTVILEAGLGVPAISWRAVQSGIATFTRVCSYDRAGYDWSDPGPMPRTTARSVLELHTLLRNAGERPPFVLVGHSFGGTNVRVYNGVYPGEVVGMVLADTGSENMKPPESFQRLIENRLREREMDGKWAPLLYWSGISRLAAGIQIDDPSLSYDKQEWAYFLIQPKVLKAIASEMDNLTEGNAELKSAGTLGNKPLIVLIARQSLQDVRLPAQDVATLSQLWLKNEELLAQLSTRGKWMMVENSTHMIPLDRPDSIVSAVREIYAETR